ncbi:MAG: VCBS domain-containing protein [Pseudomonadota bacterium]
MMPDGGGLSPEMVNDLLRTRVGEVQLAQEGDPAEVTTPAKKVGEVWFLRGDVYRVPKDAVDGTRYKLAKGDDVFEGDKIIVDGIGYFRAKMIDETRFSLGKRAQAVLSAYDYDESEQDSSRPATFEATVLRGGFQYKSGSIGQLLAGRLHHSKIKTPSAVIGIRGSELEGTYENGETIVIHESGTLTIYDINENPDTAVDLEVPGNTSVIVLNGLPSFTPAATPAQQTQLADSFPPPAADDPEVLEDNNNAGEDPADGGETTTTQSGPEINEDAPPDTDSTQNPITEPSTEETSDDVTGEDTEPSTNEEVETPTTDTTQPNEPVLTEADSTEEPATEVPPDNPPVAGSDEVSFTQNDSGVLISLTENDNDPDGGEPPVIVAIDDANTQGTVTLDPETGEISYTADNQEALAAGETATDQFTYTIQSGVLTDTAVVTVTVTGVNDAPVANPDTYTVDEDTDLSVDAAAGLLANDVDPDTGDTITVINASATTQDNTITTVNQDGTLNFFASSSAVLNALGEGETFTSELQYEITDAAGETSIANVEITVTGRNDAPETTLQVASANAITGDFELDLLENALDPDADDEPELGTVTQNLAMSDRDATGLFSVVDDELVIDTDAFADIPRDDVVQLVFDYELNDGNGLANSITMAQVTIDIVGTNTPPNANPDVAVSAEGDIITLDVLANDTDDEGNPLQVISATVVGGMEPINLDAGNTVIPVNELTGLPLFVMNQSGDYIIEPTFVALLDMYNNPETSTETFALIITDPETGEDILNPEAFGEFSVNPETGEPLVMLNQAGEIVVDPILVQEFGQAAIIDPITGEPVPFVDSRFVLPTGVAEVGPNAGSVVYAAPNDLAEGEVRIETINYIVSDGVSQSQGTATVTVTGVNDTPIVIPNSNNPEPVNVANGEVELDVLSATFDDSADLDVIAVDDTFTIGTVRLGSVFYDPGNSFQYLNVGEFALDTFSFVVEDTEGLTETGFYTVEVEGEADAPQSLSPGLAAFSEDAGIQNVDLSIGAFDPDASDVLIVQNLVDDDSIPVPLPLSGSILTVDANDFNHLNSQETVTTTFSFDLIDTTGLSVSHSFDLRVFGAADAPVGADDDGGATLENAVLNSGAFSVLDNDTDPDLSDQGNLTTSIEGTVGSPVLLPSGAEITMNADGTFEYDPNGAFNTLNDGETAVDNITYTVSDGDLAATATLSITINGVTAPPDPVQANASTFNISEESVLTVNILDNDEGSGLTVTQVMNGSRMLAIGDSTILDNGASVSVDSNGTFGYDPTQSQLLQSLTDGQSILDEFTYTVMDSGGATSVSTVSVNIDGENQEPLTYLSHDDPLTVLTTLDIVGTSGNIQAAIASVDGFEYIELDVYRTADTGAADFDLSVAQPTSTIIGTPLVLDRGDFAVTSNQWAFDDRLPTLTIEGHINEVNDYADAFQLFVQSGETLILDIDGGEDQGANGDFAIAIYDSLGTLVELHQDGDRLDRGSQNTSDPFLVFNPSVGDNYTIVVADQDLIAPSGTNNISPAFLADASYTLIAQLDSFDPYLGYNDETTVINETGYEPIHVIGDAGDTRGAPLLLNPWNFGLSPSNLVPDPSVPTITIVGDLIDTDDEDHFFVFLNVGDELTVDLDLGGNAFNEISTNVNVLNSEGVSVASDGGGASDAGSASTLDPEVVSFTATTSGFHTIVIEDDYSGETGNYVAHISVNPISGDLTPYSPGNQVLSERSHPTQNWRPDTVADQAHITADFGISVFDLGDGDVVLLGDNPASEFEQVLQTFALSNLLDDPNNETRTVLFGLADIGGLTLLDQRDVEVASTEIAYTDVLNGLPTYGTVLENSVSIDGIGSGRFHSGDFNGDGYDDVVAGTDTSAPRIYFGSDVANPSLDDMLSMELVQTTATFAYFHDIAFAGNVFGDTEEAMVGAMTIQAYTSTDVVSFILPGGTPPLVNGPGVDHTIDFSALSFPEAITLPLDWYLTPIGDIDGDGLDDLLATDDSGDAVVIFGQSLTNFGGITSLDLASPGAVEILRINGNGIDLSDGSLLNADGFSEVVDEYNAIGDVNGDGFDDLLLTLNHGSPGAALVVFGRTRDAWESREQLGEVAIDDLVNGEDSVLLLADERVDRNPRIGIADGEGIGDINGDGFDDFAVLVADEFNSQSNKYLGSHIGTFIIFGGSSLFDFAQDVQVENGLYVGDLGTDDGSHGFKLTSLELEEHTRDAHRVMVEMQPVGDVNGDGFDDVLMQPYISDEYGYRRPSDPILGDPVILLGGPGIDGVAGVLDVGSLPSHLGLNLQQAFPDDNDGWRGVGDFNGDGINDLQVGLSFADPSDVAGGDVASIASVHDRDELIIFGMPGGDDIILGTSGDDIVNRTGPSDAFPFAGVHSVYAGAGNDEIRYDADDIIIDGGGGIDTLGAQSVQPLDLRLVDNLRNIEVINLGNSAADLILDAQSVKDMDARFPVEFEGNVLVVDGGLIDEVLFTDTGWSLGGTTVLPQVDGGTYQQYINVGENVLVLVNTQILPDVTINLGDPVLDQTFSNINGTGSTVNTISLAGTMITAVNGTPVVNGQDVTLPSGAQVTIQDVSLGQFNYSVQTAFDHLSSNERGFDEFTVEVDGGADTATVYLSTVALTTVDDPLIIDTAGYTPVFNGGPHVRVVDFDNFSLSDVDTDAAGTATVTVDGNGNFIVLLGAPGVESFNITNGAGTITITDRYGGQMNLAALQEILRYVAYVPSASDGGLHQFNIQIDSANVIQNVTINGGNAFDIDTINTGAVAFASPTTWDGGSVPSPTDSVHLQAGTTGFILQSTDQTIDNLVVAAPGDAVLQIQNATLTVTNQAIIDETTFPLAPGVELFAATDDAVLDAGSIEILTDIRLSPSDGFSTILRASSYITLEGELTVLATTADSISNAILEAPFINLQGATIDLGFGNALGDPGTDEYSNLTISHPDGTSTVTVSVDEDTQFFGHPDSRVNIINGNLQIEGDFMHGYLVSGDAPIFDLIGDGTISGNGRFINNIDDFDLSSDTVEEGVTIVNVGQLNIGTTTLNGDFENRGATFFTGGTPAINGSFYNGPLGQILIGNPGPIVASTVINIDENSVLRSEGTIRVVDSGQVIDGNVDLTDGELILSVGTSLTFNNAGHVLNLSGTDIRFDGISTLTVDGGFVIIDNDTKFDGSTGGLLNILSNVTVLAIDLDVDLHDSAEIEINGFFGPGNDTLDFLETGGRLDDGEIPIGIYDFVGFAEIDDDSDYTIVVDTNDGAGSGHTLLQFENLVLDGVISPDIRNTPVGGESYGFLMVSRDMRGSFDILDNAIVDATPGAELIADLRYDYTPGMSTVTLDIHAVTQGPAAGPTYTGTAGMDVILGGAVGNTYNDIGDGDIIIDQMSSFETFNVTSMDFQRIAGEAGGTNRLVLEDTISLADFTLKPGTALENITEIDVSASGPQTVILNEEMVNDLLDDQNGPLFITDFGANEGDMVILQGNFEQGLVSASTEYLIDGRVLVIDNSILVQIEPELNGVTLFGTDGNDVLTGLESNDRIDGGFGGDTIHAMGGNDAVRYDDDDLSINGGSGLDTLLIDEFDFVDLSGVTNIADFEKIELGPGASLEIRFEDLFGGANLVGGVVDLYSSDPTYGDYQIWIDGDDNSVSLTLTTEIPADPGSFASQSIDTLNSGVGETLGILGIQSQNTTTIDGETVYPFTKGDVTIFISADLFDSTTY